jgi:hypothetical protein
MTSDRVEKIADNILEGLVNKNMFFNAAQAMEAWEVIYDELKEEFLDEL